MGISRLEEKRSGIAGLLSLVLLYHKLNERQDAVLFRLRQRSICGPVIRNIATVVIGDQHFVRLPPERRGDKREVFD